jgi:hypothetical protein
MRKLAIFSPVEQLLIIRTCDEHGTPGPFKLVCKLIGYSEWQVLKEFKDDDEMNSSSLGSEDSEAIGEFLRIAKSRSKFLIDSKFEMPIGVVSSLTGAKYDPTKEASSQDEN